MVRILMRPRLPFVVPLRFAPTIPELRAGSSPFTRFVTDPAAFAVDMLVPWFLWDVLLETAIPGLVAVAAGAADLLDRLGRALELRERNPSSFPGAVGPP